MKKTIIALLVFSLAICTLFTGCKQQVITITSEITESDEASVTSTDDVTSTQDVTSDTTTSADGGSEDDKSSSSQKPTSTPTFTPPTTSKEDTSVKFENTYKVADNKDAFKYTNRATMAPQGIKFNTTADGVEFKVNCKGQLAVNLTVDSLNTSAGFGMYFTVYLDGIRQQTRHHVNQKGKVELLVAEGLSDGEHHVEIYRQTESKYGGDVYLTSVSCNGTLGSKPADRDVYIEFIGDSITAGYGSVKDKVDMQVTTGDAPGIQDGTGTYAFLAAKRVNADIAVVARTGIGVVKGYEPVLNGQKQTMAEVYDYFPDLTLQNKFTYTRTPDIYVINLGTNDLGNGVTAAQLETGMKQLINKLLGNNPKAKIVLVGGMATSGVDNTINKIYSQLGGENAGIYKLITKPSPNFHPNSVEHNEYSVQLTKVLQKAIAAIN
ncbi:MAG: hypothetical protein IJN65_06120 [Clostridia bacterium]|nr:hypothetical protein [Clostridia bacterium]